MLLARQGLRVLLVDRGTHPRFAIGESSTPIADMILRDLARQHDIPELLPLTRFGSWQATYPQLRCGCKRGFSYFFQRAEEEFASAVEHDRELLVAASTSRALADTHWLRSDVDQFLCQLAREYGVTVIEGCDVHVCQDGSGWRLSGVHEAGKLNTTAPFVLDATGAGGALREVLNLGNDAASLFTSTPGFSGSRAIYGHFEGVMPWTEVLDDLRVPQIDYPFPCDDAALHHVLEEGWMWQLRFANGLVSAGFMLDVSSQPIPTSITPQQEWDLLLNRYPSICKQFQQATLVAPATGLQRTGAIQRLVSRAAGDNWALLPHSAGFIDPLHSTGIAHTLAGIERIIPILQQGRGGALEVYGESIRRELQWIHELVSLCYRVRQSPQLFTLATMLYFAAVTSYEQARVRSGTQHGFLYANHAPLRQAAREVANRLLLAARQPASYDLHDVERDVADMLQPFNQVGLCDLARHNMYEHTAPPKN